jgi:hypothetical protein
MDMRLRFSSRQPEPKPPQPVTPAPASPPGPAVERSVLVQHGIHTGHFPVAGLRVQEIRQTLTPLLNIDPQAVAVINGRVVAETTVVSEDVALLSFVKPSAIKGAGV